MSGLREPLFVGRIVGPPTGAHVPCVFVDHNADEWATELRMGALNPPDRAALVSGAIIDWTPPNPPMVRLAPRWTAQEIAEAQQAAESLAAWFDEIT